MTTAPTDATLPPNAPSDALRALFDARWSCRAFLPDPVPRATVERILRTAQRTASWCNAQPWRIHVLGGDAVDAARAALPDWDATHAPEPDFAWPAAYRGVSLERRRACGFALYEAVGVARGDRAAAARQAAGNFAFFGAPHVALVTSDRDLGIYGAVDCGAWTASFLLAAATEGVATIAQAALAAHPRFWRERLGLSEDRLVVCGVSFGWPDRAHPANGFRTARAALGEVVDWIDAAPGEPSVG